MRGGYRHRRKHNKRIRQKKRFLKKVLNTLLTIQNNIWQFQNAQTNLRIVGRGLIRFGLILAALWWAVKSFAGSTAGAVLYLPGKIKFSGFSGLDPVIEFDLKIQNVTPISFTVNSFAGEIYYQNKYVANISSFYKQTVAANSQTIYKLKAIVSLGGFGTQIVQAIRNKNRNFAIDLKGSANINGVPVPVQITYKII